MKLGWGYIITILYVGFVAMMVVMVSLTMRQKVDLVSKDYYEEELHYQDRIDKINRTQKLKDALTWEIQKTGVTFIYPQEFKGRQISGTVMFTRPSDAALDRTMLIATDTAGRQFISTKKFKTGVHKIQINWVVDNIEYFNESVITIN